MISRTICWRRVRIFHSFNLLAFVARQHHLFNRSSKMKERRKFMWTFDFDLLRFDFNTY